MNQQLYHAPPHAKVRGKPASKAHTLRPLILLGVAAAILSVLVWILSRRPQEPAAPDYGEAAGAWMRNEQGYYYAGDEATVLPAAVSKGMDVSKYQGTVDWEKAKAAGIEYALLRCGFGSEWNGEGEYAQDDATWRTNADACTALGIPFGCYLYSYATTVEEAQSEADHVARLLGLLPATFEGQEDYTASPYRLSLPVYYDLEDKAISGLYEDEMAELCTAFFDRLEQDGYTGAEGLYASYNWVLSRFENPGYDRWREHLWIAKFQNAEPDYTGLYERWQASYTADGAAYGVESETVDLDFTMKPLRLTGITKAAEDVRYTNDNRNMTLWLPTVGDTAALDTNAAELTGNEKTKVYWQSSNPDVAKVNRKGTVTAKAEGTAVLTATLPDGSQSVQCTVYVGNIAVEIYATGQLHGCYENDTVSLADVAALRERARQTDANAPEGIVLDVGSSLQGTRQTSITGGMDAAEAMAAADYDIQVFDTADLAFGVGRLLSDAVVTDGFSLAADLLDEDGNALFARSTSWNRNRISNGKNCLLERAGMKIGFFALCGGNPAIATPNETTPAYADLLNTAARQTAALTAKGADAIVCLIGADVPAETGLYNELANMGVTAAIDGRITTPPNSVLPVAAAGGGLEQVASLTLTFGVDTAEAEPGWVPDEELSEAQQSYTAAENSTAARSLYTETEKSLQEMAQGDAELEEKTLFTLAQEPEQPEAFADWLAQSMADWAEQQRTAWDEAAQDLPLTVLSACTECPAYTPGTLEVSRGALADAVGTGTRLQLVQTTTAALEKLQSGGEFTVVQPEGTDGEILLLTDTDTLQGLEGSYTLIRDYGDTYWNVRRMINDATDNFTGSLVLQDEQEEN